MPFTNNVTFLTLCLVFLSPFIEFYTFEMNLICWKFSFVTSFLLFNRWSCLFFIWYLVQWNIILRDILVEFYLIFYLIIDYKIFYSVL